MYVSKYMARYTNLASICMNGYANLANHPQESGNRACAGSTEGAHAGSVNIDIID